MKNLNTLKELEAQIDEIDERIETNEISILEKINLLCKQRRLLKLLEKSLKKLVK
jgi:hypothetical protein